MAGSQLGSRLAWMISMNLAKVSSFATVDQSLVERMLEALDLSEIRLLGLEAALGTGARLGARWVVVGSVAEADGGLAVEARILEVDGGGVLAADTVRGPRDESFVLADRLASGVVRALTGKILRFGNTTPVRFDQVLRLTPADMAKHTQIAGYAVIHRDLELGWELGVSCTGRTLRYCSSVTFRVSRDLSVRDPTRGVDGLAVIDYARGGSPTLSTHWPEAALEGVGQTLILEVEPLSAVFSQDVFNPGRPEGRVFGAVQFEVRVRVSGVYRSLHPQACLAGVAR